MRRYRVVRRIVRSIAATAAAAAAVVAPLGTALVLLLLAPGQAHAGRDPFHDPRALNARLQELHDAHPTTTRLVTIATATRGEVKALEADASGRFAREAPALLLQGGVHGNEWISTEVVLRLAELVIEASSPATAGLIYRFVPAVNLDGFATGNRQTVEPGGFSYDPNRDFPVPGQPDHRSRALIQALRDYTRTGNIVAVLDYHSAAECMLWPWAYTAAKQPPDAAALAEVARDMAASVGYCSGQVATVIPYKHQGTAADWYQDALKAPAILVELSAADEPGSQTVEQILIDQERPFWIFLSWLERRGLKSARAEPAIPSSGTAAACQTTTITVGIPPLGYRATGQLCSGRREGPWRFTFLTGEPMREGTYRLGLEQGPWRTYHRDGGTQDVGHYLDGKPDAVWRRHARAGMLIEARLYTSGQRDGLLVRWTEDGTLWQVRWCRQGPCRTICKHAGEQGCLSPSATKKPRKPSRAARR